MSIPVTQKKRGRPPTGVTPILTVRLPPALVTKLMAWAGERGLSRSEAIRRLIDLGMAASDRGR